MAQCNNQHNIICTRHFSKYDFHHDSPSKLCYLNRHVYYEAPVHISFGSKRNDAAVLVSVLRNNMRLHFYGSFQKVQFGSRKQSE